MDDILAAGPRSSSKSSADNTRVTILLVEDEDDVRTMCRRALELDGSIIIEANDGVGALSLVQQWNKPLDLVITDMRMPRLDGAELAGLLSVFRPDLPILAMTGDPGMTDRRLPTILKPFSFEELIETAYRVRTRVTSRRTWGQERRAQTQKARQLAAAMMGRNHSLRSRLDLVAVALELQRLGSEAQRGISR